jgi:hypothetical protein
MEIDELTALFTKLGAPAPEAWAQSQVEEGIDQLGRFVFSREAWKAVVPPHDAAWIDTTIAGARARPTEPGAGVGPALVRLLAAGADRRDLHEVVRVMQYEVLFSLCYLLGDPGGLEPELSDVSWHLVRTDADGEIIGTIDGLHESVLEMEPSGRELRPEER